jgi:Cu+-exporting ATPase
MSTTAPVTTVELAIGGMTCASCANRIERKLNKLDGVSATVNYATEKARVEATGDVDPAVLIGQVEAAGYTAELPRPAANTEQAGPEEDPTRPLRNRLITSAVLAAPVIALAMVPALQFTYWQWISLALAGPVVTWAAWPFHRAAWANLRHGTATMDTLISMGVLAAFVWSLYALLFGTAGVPGMVHPFELTISPPETSISRSPPASPRSSWPAATSRPGRSAGPGRRCGRFSSSARRTSPCCGAAPRCGSRPTSSPWATGSS